jgi:hypothetical protein
VDLAKQVRRAEAWIATNPERRPRKQPARFLGRWLRNAESEDER